MKRTVSFLLAILTCIGMVGLLASCDEGHEHSFAAAWSSDATNHWHACTDSACHEVSEKAAHTFANYVCSVCGYKTTPPEPATEQVSESVFGAALSFEGVTSVTIGQTQKNEDGKTETTYHVEGAKSKVITEGETIYYHVDGNEVWYYFYNENMGWIREALGASSGMAAMMADPIATFSAMLEGISFANLTYTDGYYVGEAILYGEENVTVSLGFKSSKLTYAHFALDGNENDTVTLTFSHYGTTTVTLPEILIDPNEWMGYFELDNFTATLVHVLDYEDYDMHTVTNEALKIGDGKWLFTSDNYAYNDMLYSRFNVYFDGTNAYVNGVIDNEENDCAEMFIVNITWFKYYLASFGETAPGIFEAALINTDYGTIYKDVRIAVQDGKLASISYKAENTQYSYSEEYTYTFTAVGTTVVDGTGYTEPSVWSTYFNFDNVTVEYSLASKYNGDMHESSSKIIWRMSGNRWVGLNYDGATLDETAYFDGTNGYLNGEVADVAEYSFAHKCFVVGQMVFLEDSFTKTEQGTKTIYTAEKITVYGSIEYVDIELVVEDGHIVSATYASVDELSGGSFVLIYNITFANYGTTVVENPFA